MARNNPTRKHHGGGKKDSAKNKSAAAFLRAQGARRSTGVCCICGKTVPLASLANHYRLHGG
jgi:hypothetical protein